MPRQLLLEGPAIEPLLRQVRAEHGESARVLKAERVRVGGVGGFFAREKYEVTFEVDDAATPPRDAPDAAGSGTASVFGPAVAQRGASPSGGNPPKAGAPRGLAALLAAAEEAERAAGSPSEADDSSPSAAALAAVRDAMAGRGVDQPPLSTEKAAFTEVLDSVRSGLEGSGPVRAPDDARSLTGDRGDEPGDHDAGTGADDTARASAIEQLRRALDALGMVDDTQDDDTQDDGDAGTQDDDTQDDDDEGTEGVGGPEDVDHEDLDADLPAGHVWAQEVFEEHETGGAHRSPGAPDDVGGPGTEEPPPPAHPVAMLQEMPAELARREGVGDLDAGDPDADDPDAGGDAPRPAEGDDAGPAPVVERPDTDATTAAAGSTGDADTGGTAVAAPEPPPLTRRERRRAEAAARDHDAEQAEGPAAADHADGDDGATLVLPPPDPTGAPTTVDEPSTPTVVLPRTLAELGEPDPGDPLPELPRVPEERLAAAARRDPDALEPGEPSGAAGEADPSDPAEPSGTPHPPQPDGAAGAADPSEPSERQPEPLHDRLARLGVHGRWLDGLPQDQVQALRVLAERLTALQAHPRRTPRAADHPVVAVVAEGTGAGLETARTLALSLGLRADEVVTLAVEDHRTARPGASPVDRGAAARAAHAGRRHNRPVVVLVPVPFTPTPGERAAGAAVLATLDADQVWAVVDATRRTSDVESWLRAVAPGHGVDAVALTGLAATTAPAESLGLSAPVVLLDGQPATAVDWVATLAAHLTREDVGAHLARVSGVGAGS